MLSGVSNTPPTLKKLVMSQKLVSGEPKSPNDVEGTGCDSFSPLRHHVCQGHPPLSVIHALGSP
jgi:hypothetical protein